MGELRHVKIALLISGLLLCLGVVPVWAYGYYAFLRLAVCATCIYTAVNFRKDPARAKHFIPLVFLALLFNPLFPVYLTRLFWLVMDLLTAVYFLSLAKKIPVSS